MLFSNVCLLLPNQRTSFFTSVFYWSKQLIVVKIDWLQNECTCYNDVYKKTWGRGTDLDPDQVFILISTNNKLLGNINNNNSIFQIVKSTRVIILICAGYLESKFNFFQPEAQLCLFMRGVLVILMQARLHFIIHLCATHRSATLWLCQCFRFMQHNKEGLFFCVVFKIITGDTSGKKICQ